MAKFKVTVVEEVMHVVDVEADTEEEAGEIAIQAVIDSPDEAFFMAVEDRYVKMALKGT